MAQSTVKIDPKWLKIDPELLKNAQNRPKMAQSRPQNGQSRVTLSNGHSGWHSFAAFGPPGPNLGNKRGLKAPFAAKFGMHLRVLAVFSGPVHGRGAQRESKWLKTGPKWPKLGPKWLKMAQSTVKIGCPAGYLMAVSVPFDSVTLLWAIWGPF